MAWRVAKSLLKLRDQINAAYPNRSKSSDGTIGDEGHSSRVSDHNPNEQGVVCAMDITNDPAHGLSSEELAQALVRSKDRRIKYIISNRKICSGLGQGQPTWQWRPYSGKNPHDHHCHISVRSPASFYDDASDWQIDGMPAAIDHPEPSTDESPMLRRGVKGNNVVTLQRLLNARGASLTEDGDFGVQTEKAVVAFQAAHNLVADGIVGAYTWQALRA